MADNNHISLSGHVRELDGVRGLAVLLVQWYHFSKFGRSIFGTTLGEIGVGLFFVLSGFLITGILADNIAKNRPEGGHWHFLRQFYIRRFLRLAPLFYIVLSLAIVLNIPPFRSSWPWHAAYLSNFYQWIHDRSGYGSNLWSLAVEEQFYALWPFVIVFVSLRFRFVIAVSLIVIALGFRILVLTLLPQKDPQLMLPAVGDYLGAGALLAIGARSGNPRFRRIASRVMLIAGVAGILLVEFSGLWWVFRSTAWSLVLGAFVAAASLGMSGLRGKILRSNFLVYFGRISYGIYVIQGFALFYWYWLLYSSPLPLERFLTKCGIVPSLFAWGVAEVVMPIVITVGLASLSYHFFERPINSLKRYFPYRTGSDTRREEPLVACSARNGSSNHPDHRVPDKIGPQD